jgi:integrase
MPRPASPPRLWKRSARRDKAGNVTHAAAWIILDGGRQFSTGVKADDLDGANKALAEYIGQKYTAAARSGPRRAENIPVADVLHLYLDDVVPKHSDPAQTKRRIQRLHKFFSPYFLGDINGQLCRAYAKQASTDSMARSELIVLKAAINYHLQEGLHDRVIKVVLPPRRPPRERWLTRSEAAQMLWRAWRTREVRGNKITTRFPRRHLAHFILLGLYTGSRSAVLASAAFEKEPGKPYIDLENGLFYRRPEGSTDTKKRRPTVRIPPRLLAHLRRWKRLGYRYPVEINGQPIQRIRFAFQWTVEELGLPGKITPHTIRHTAATWLMRAGVDLWEAAGFLGMSVQTLERNYGHHHPDQYAGVHGAFQRRPTANVSPTINVNQSQTSVGDYTQNAKKISVG